MCCSIGKSLDTIATTDLRCNVWPLAHGSKRSQRPDYFCDFILLKQADAGDAGRSRFRQDAAFSSVTPPRARTGIFARQASRSAVRPAVAFRASASLSEHGSEDGEVGALGAHHVLIRVAGDGHQEVVSGQWPVPSQLHNRVRFRGLTCRPRADERRRLRQPAPRRCES